MRKERRNIPTALLLQNDGQIDWLPKNPRKWTDDDIEKTRKSIEEDPDFLEDRPLLVLNYEERFLVFAGNLRSLSGRNLETMPSVIYFPETDEDRETIKRRAMKDNGAFGKWDTAILASEWGQMPLSDWGVPDGWNVDAEQRKERAAKEDDFDEETDKVLDVCKKGEIYQLGEHRLMCGDSSDIESVKSLMGGAMADIVFTDPPYGVAIGDKNMMLNTIQRAGRSVKNIENDNKPLRELYGILLRVMENVRETCNEDACYYVCSPPGGDMGMMFLMMMNEAGLGVRHQLVWNKSSATFSLGRLDYDYKHESILYTWTKKHHNYRKGKFRTTVWDIDKPRKCDLHPTMKPVELVANCLLDGSKEGDNVLDVFGGSGTTLIAAEQLGRRAYIMEIDPHYCDVIIARWEKLTGKKAVKIRTHENYNDCH